MTIPPPSTPTPAGLTAFIDRGTARRSSVWLTERLASTPDGPLLPICSRRSDVMAAILAGMAAGRRIIFPNDSGRAALEAIAAETAEAVVILSPGDPPPALPWPVLELPAGAPPTAPVPDWQDGPGLTLYTSGSTGRPEPHVHAPAFFRAGAQVWADRLELQDDPASIVATVPAQHMYGLEGSIILPLLRPRTETYDGRPFYPADIQAALGQAPGRRVLLTTPLHLRALVRSGLAMPAVHRVVSATAPLDANLARAAESLLAAPVIEVYGSTETGLAATRRPARTDIFVLQPDLVMERDDTDVRLTGPHLPTPVTLQDRVEPSDGGFRLLGRGHDLVNIGGKRTSLAGLTATLQALDGVEDGTVIMPEAGPLARPVAVVHAPELTAEAVRRGLRDQLPELFVPRRVVMSPRPLPRSPTGKLTAAAIQSLLAAPAPADEDADAFTIPADHPALPGHFPGDPVVPGAVILAHALDLAGLSGPVALRSVKFTGVLRPGERCTVLVEVGRRGRTLSCSVDDRPILTATLALPRSREEP